MFSVQNLWLNYTVISADLQSFSLCTRQSFPFIFKNTTGIKYIKTCLNLETGAEDSENSSLFKLLYVSVSCHCYIFGIFPSTQSHILANNKEQGQRVGKKGMFRKLVLKIIKKMVWEIEISHLSETTE